MLLSEMISEQEMSTEMLSECVQPNKRKRGGVAKLEHRRFLPPRGHLRHQPGWSRP